MLILNLDIAIETVESRPTVLSLIRQRVDTANGRTASEGEGGFSLLNSVHPVGRTLMDISVGRIVCKNPFNESMAVSPHRTPTHCCILHLLCYRSVRVPQPLPYVNHAAKKTSFKKSEPKSLPPSTDKHLHGNDFPNFAWLPALTMPATYRTVLQRGLPLKSVGWRVFSPANGSLENASDRCIMFDQLPVFVSTQLNLNWKWLHIGLMM